MVFETLILIISLVLGIIWVTKVLIKKYKEWKNIEPKEAQDENEEDKKEDVRKKNNNALQFAWVVSQEKLDRLEEAKRKKRERH